MNLITPALTLFLLLTTTANAAEKLKCSNNASHKVHLTFDDGPKIPETEKILNALASARPKVKATFLMSTTKFKFVLKKKPSQYSRAEKSLLRVLKRIQRDGHKIGSHSFKHLDHSNKGQNSRREINSNLANNLAVWKKLGLEIPAPFRFPYGAGWFKERSPSEEKSRRLSLKIVKNSGFTPFHWDIDSWDWSKIKRKALPYSVLQQICTHSGGVALFHDIQSFTAQNIGRIIKSIQASGHRLVSFDEIKKDSDQRNSPRYSFRDSAVGIFYCNKSVGNVDQVWGSCGEYEDQSINARGQGATQ